VTVVFCDVTGSTKLGESLDPEALRALLARYFATMKGIVERHGGSVEKFIGDAVMAVFGVPVLHEDDAVRALRAAAEMRDALPGLGVQGRIGAMTGEVVTGTPERLATGDAVNVAARLEQAAQPGEVLVGEPTLALAAGAVDAEPVIPLRLRGKQEPVAAFRLVRVRPGASERRHETRFVGRSRELEALRSAWDRVQADCCCELVTVIGDAGVGKSRLTAEFLAPLDAAIVQGRCLPYGEGITYWPVVEVVKQLGVWPVEKAAAAAIRSLLGETGAPTSADEIAWAFRKALEQAASERPVIVIFDDIQWGEDTFLDLVEHISLLSAAAVLLVCLARPELVERRPAWPVGLRLEPLAREEVDELLPEPLPGDLRARIAHAAGGNPLFLAEMVAMAAHGAGEVIVPPTLRALLGARLDQLDPAERHVLECGAIEGEIFHRGAVTELARQDATPLSPRLAALIRKQLIRPDRAQIAGDDGFRFRHLLIRDAAYDALPKAVRADLHQRFATWMDDQGAALVELDEIVGYHLEQACRFRAELGTPDNELAAAARRRLTAAGHRARLRADWGAATSLLERAAALADPAGLDLALEADLLEALEWGRGEGADALQRAESLIERARAAGDQVVELCGRIRTEQVRISYEPEGATARLEAIIDRALPVFEAAGNNVALHIAYSAMNQVAFVHARFDQALDAHERARALALDAGARDGIFMEGATARLYGTTPVTELLSWLGEPEQQLSWSPLPGLFRGAALAMLGNFTDARAVVSQSRAAFTEPGVEQAFWTGALPADIEFLAGDTETAVALKTEACRQLDQFGERGYFSTIAASLARMLCDLDRLDEAEAWSDRARQLGGSDDAETQILWRRAHAEVLARRGDHATAVRLAREAVALAETTEGLNIQADAYGDLADVLARAGHMDEAQTALQRAFDKYERKGNVVMAERLRARSASTT
jgi:class 3 adenylate cyclase/tetratricopeptide (TPR) repeat protein